MKIGYKLIAEAYSPKERVRQAVRAEEAGFDFVEISDHFHPWFDSQNHSGFAWSILAAAAMRTSAWGSLPASPAPLFVTIRP
jgi:alkanesulfonate monooxygenase SsuD/methylene tetrahydromethanopterin reductase-like flavin-dependent oxidoreductase (luciferase family)